MVKARSRAYFELLVVSLIWGFAAIVIKKTLHDVSPIPFLTIRFFLSGLLIFVTFRSIKRLFNKGITRSIKLIIFCLFSTSIPLGFLFLGLTYSSVLNLSIVQAATPIVLAMAASYSLGEHHSRHQKIGALIALFGTFFTLAEPIFVNGHDNFQLYGSIFFALYLLVDIVSMIWLKRLLREKTDALALTNLSFGVGFLSLLPITLYVPDMRAELMSIPSLPFLAVLGILYMAFFSGTLAYALRAKAQKTISVTDLGLFGYLTPLFSAIFALIFLSEKITPIYAIGSAIVILGVIIAEVKKHPKT